MDISLSHSLNVMPPVLKTFLCWLLDDVAYDTVNKDHTIPPEKLRKCMALAETTVSINKNSFTPFSLGLALQMHHVYGSKNLVETLHSHGFYASYNELRRYLTNLADHEINKIENGTYIPHGICSLPGEVTLIQKGADNADINTETIDGKDQDTSRASAFFTSHLVILSCASSQRIGSMHSLGLSYDKQLIRASVFSISGKERS
jgi:hypothetical protein